MAAVWITRVVGGLAAIVTAVAVAGCGQGQGAEQSAQGTHGAEVASTPSPGVSPSQPPGAASRPSGAVPESDSTSTAGAVSDAPPQCATSDLDVTLGQGNAGAGTVGFPIVFGNIGSNTCVLQGFPGVSYVAERDGDPIGAPAVRDGDPSGPVRLAPGEQASALVLEVNVHNIPAESCRPVAVPGLRIYVPDNTESVYLERSGTACGNSRVTTDQLRVRSVVAGADGQ